MRHPLAWVTALLLAAVVPTTALAAAAAAPKTADVKITNRTDWTLHDFYLSSSGEDTWGPDQLGDDVIKSGESFTLAEVPCDKYDVKLVDEDAQECILGKVDICGEAQEWVITSKDLVQCQAGTEAAKKGDA